jgi:hypothetical protein
MQCTLVTTGNGLEKAEPLLFGYANL